MNSNQWLSSLSETEQMFLKPGRFQKVILAAGNRLLFKTCQVYSRAVTSTDFRQFVWASLVVFGLLSVGCGREEDAAVEVGTVRDLALSVPAEATVGVGQTIRLSGDVPDEAPAQLSLLGSYGIWLYESGFENGEALFDIPADELQQAGFVTAIGQVGESQVTERFELLAGPPVEPLIPLVGPNTITADGKSWSVMSIVPFDQFANPVADGTPVTFRVFHPGNILEEFIRDTDHLMAWSRINSRTIAGKTFISAQIGEAYGKEVSILQTPGWPAPFTLTNEPVRVPADGLTLTHVRTSRITDQFGNVIPDGSLVTLVVTDAEGRRRHLPTQTVDGFAEVAIQAPLQPERHEVIGIVFSVESEPLTIEYDPGPAVGVFPIEVELGTGQYAGSYLFRAGPLLGERDQYVPNSTPVTFVLTHQSGLQAEGTELTLNGYALFSERIENMESGRYTITATLGPAEGKAAFDFEK